MERRGFLRACTLAGGAGALAANLGAWADASPRYYAKTRLVDIHGAPIRIAALAADTNYVFQYPYAATPCFLLKLSRAPSQVPALRREDGATYAWNGGVGPGRNVVSFSAICAHRLAYPTRDVSFIRFQKERSATSDGSVIHCCADHSVYDPTAGARVVAGPAPQPLAAVLLTHDAERDEVHAVEIGKIRCLGSGSPFRSPIDPVASVMSSATPVGPVLVKPILLWFFGRLQLRTLRRTQPGPAYRGTRLYARRLVSRWPGGMGGRGSARDGIAIQEW